MMEMKRMSSQQESASTMTKTIEIAWISLPVEYQMASEAKEDQSCLAVIL
jgi:hypothetical protein